MQHTREHIPRPFSGYVCTRQTGPPGHKLPPPPARLSRLKLFNRDWIFRVPGAEINHIQKFTTSQVDTLSYPRSAGGGAGAQGGTGDKYLYQMSCTLCAIGVCVCVPPYMKDKGRKKGKGRRCCFGGRNSFNCLLHYLYFPPG